ncbi:hypothetical protein VM98_38055, partial [Streptomyces rubellomurinus subsp. indigoferus]
ALARPEAVLAPVRLDLAGRHAAELPPLLAGLATRRPGTDRTAPHTGRALARRLAASPAAEPQRHLVHVVRTHAVAALRHPAGGAIDPARPFNELRLDSFAPLEPR